MTTTAAQPPDTQPVRPPWADTGRWPTGPELRTWLEQQPEEARDETLTRLLAQAYTGALCVQAAHADFPHELHHRSLALLRALNRGDRYRLAWLSAARRARWTRNAVDGLLDDVRPTVTLDEATETVTLDRPPQ